MKITLLEADRLGNYTVEAEDGRTEYFQLDWDFPGLASSFGWAPCHDGTDGTVDCAECGRTVSESIASAVEFLDEHWGDSIEDPGYFGS